MSSTADVSWQLGKGSGSFAVLEQIWHSDGYANDAREDYVLSLIHI